MCHGVGEELLAVMWSEVPSEEEWRKGMTVPYVTLPPSSRLKYKEECRNHWEEHMNAALGVPECPSWCLGEGLGLDNTTGTCATCCEGRAMAGFLGQEHFLGIVTQLCHSGLHLWDDETVQVMLGESAIGSD